MAEDRIDIYSKNSEDHVSETGNWNKEVTKIFKKILGNGISFEVESSNNNDSNNNSNSNSNNEAETREGSEVSIGRFCNNDIPLDYAFDAFKNADYIFISHDIRADGNRGSIRGFMCVQDNHNARDEHEEGTLYIDLICNSSRTSARSAAKRQQTGLAGGRILLDAIKRFAVENGYQRVALKALETVIPYYYKFGWRFISSCGDTESGAGMSEAVSELSAALKAHHQQNPDMGDLKQNPRINAALQKFKKFLPGIHDETAMRAAKYQNDDMLEELLQQDQSTVKLHEATTRDNGYAMLWCADDGVAVGKQAAKKGGRRKRKTRRKRNKKSKKTRRKKHHKKRTRRKRRGGKGPAGNRSRYTRRARERGVNIMPTIKEPRVWQVKENKTTGNNIMRNRIKKIRGNK